MLVVLQGTPYTEIEDRVSSFHNSPADKIAKIETTHSPYLTHMSHNLGIYRMSATECHSTDRESRDEQRETERQR